MLCGGGWQTSRSLRNSTALHVIDVLILLIFAAEAGLRIAADWPDHHKYFDDAWNRFDFVIVVSLRHLRRLLLPENTPPQALKRALGPQVSGLIEMLIALAGVDMGGAAGCLIVLRLFRLLRLLKMMRALPQLQLLAASLLNSLPSMVWVCVPMLIIFYIFACLGCILFQKNDNKYFGNLWRALVTLCQGTTLDTWNNIMYIQIYGCGTYYRPQVLATHPQP